jgi:hypothetical protein
VGEALNVSGTVIARTPSGVARIVAQRSRVNENELVATAADSYVRIRFKDGGEITLRPSTQLRIDRYAFEESRPASDSIFLSLLKGGLRAVTGGIARRNPKAFRMETGTATIGIRGTHYGALLCQDDCAGLSRTDGQALANGLHLDVEEGCITTVNDVGQGSVCLGEFAYVRDRSSQLITVPPEAGIRVPVTDWPQRGPGGVDGSPECLL